LGRTEGDRWFDASGRYLARWDGDRLYDASGRLLYRFDGVRRTQAVVYYFFF
jgi:hypothetical protein